MEGTPRVVLSRIPDQLCFLFHSCWMFGAEWGPCGMTAVAGNEVAETASKEDRHHARVRRVGLVHSRKLLEISEKNPRFTGRGKLVHSLIEAYGLLNRLRVVEPEVADRRGLQSFHSAAYLAFLHSHSHTQAGGDEVGEEEEAYGLGYDCPVFPGLYEYVCAIAGSSLAAADSLVKGEVDVAINWYGGWHHGKKDEASGFCYCNDIVLAILRLLIRFTRVLYVDMDIHHGDGVEDAFFHTPRVMTVSLHNFSPGFFPGSGDVDSVGAGRGRFHCVNIPLRDGVRDDQYEEIFTRVLSEVKGRFRPDVVVLQCGADMLSGGYHFANTARLWAYLTGLAMQHTLTNEIPEHENFECYGPDFELHFDAGHRPTQNSQKAVEELLQTIAGHLSNVTVQLQ